MTETIQPEATTDSPAKRGWASGAIQWAKEPPTEVVNFLIVFGVILSILAAGFGILVFFSLGFQVLGGGKEGPEAGKAIIPAIIALVAAPFLIWRLIMMQSQTTTALEKLEIDRETQNTALYLKAVEMLGSMKEEKTTEKIGEKFETTTVSKPDLEKRIGALFALERLARDSERDHPAILDMLCAYVRRNSGLDNYDKEMLEDERLEWPLPRQDIQTAVTVIGRRKDKWQNGGITAGLINLYQSKLMRINLAKLDLAEADFQGAILTRAILHEANLNKAILQDTNMTMCQLHRAELQGANLIEAQMQMSRLYRANLESADLSGAKLQKAVFSRTNLKDVDFFVSNLSGAILGRAENLTQNQVDSANGDEQTTLPRHITPPSHWLSWNEERAESPSPPDDDIPF